MHFSSPLTGEDQDGGEKFPAKSSSQYQFSPKDVKHERQV
jgi:hypothetical protein